MTVLNVCRNNFTYDFHIFSPYVCDSIIFFFDQFGISLGISYIGFMFYEYFLVGVILLFLNNRVWQQPFFCAMKNRNVCLVKIKADINFQQFNFQVYFISNQFVIDYSPSFIHCRIEIELVCFSIFTIHNIFHDLYYEVGTIRDYQFGNSLNQGLIVFYFVYDIISF